MLTLLGCATIGTFQPADTLGEGGKRLGLATSYASADGVGIPHVDGSWTTGLAPQVDASVSLGTSGLGVGGKLQLTPPEEAVVLSLAATIYVFPVPQDADADGFGAGVSGQAMMLLGLPLGPHQLVLAPKVHGTTNLDRLAAGGSVGIAFRGRRVAFIPEVSVTVGETVWVQAGVALLLGG